MDISLSATARAIDVPPFEPAPHRDKSFLINDVNIFFLSNKLTIIFIGQADYLAGKTEGLAVRPKAYHHRPEESENLRMILPQILAVLVLLQVSWTCSAL